MSFPISSPFESTLGATQQPMQFAGDVFGGRPAIAAALNQTFGGPDEFKPYVDPLGRGGIDMFNRDQDESSNPYNFGLAPSPMPTMNTTSLFG